MRKILVLLAVLSFLPICAAEDTTTVGQYTFEMTDGAWLMTGLPENFEIEEGYVCKHKDEIWEKWYNSGDEMLRQILDLGSNIVFKMKSSVDGQEHIFSVSDDGKPIIGALAATGGMSTATKVALGVGGAGAAVLIIDNASDDDEASKAKR